MIKDLDKDTNAEVVVHTIVDFAKRLNISTVAEYIHNKEVFAKVKELDINKSQGFFLSEPKADVVTQCF